MSDEDEFDQFALNGMTMPSKYKSVFGDFLCMRSVKMFCNNLNGFHVFCECVTHSDSDELYLFHKKSLSINVET